MQNEERQITFNDIPEVLSEILKRFDLLDQSMERGCNLNCVKACS